MSLKIFKKSWLRTSENEMRDKVRNKRIFLFIITPLLCNLSCSSLMRMYQVLVVGFCLNLSMKSFRKVSFKSSVFKAARNKDFFVGWRQADNQEVYMF